MNCSHQKSCWENQPKCPPSSFVLRALTVSVAVVALGIAGCTTSKKDSDQTWLDLFTPDQDQPVAAARTCYDANRLETDCLTLSALRNEMDSLADDMARMRRTLVFKKQPYLGEEENRQVELLLFRFVNVRDALWDIVNFYRTNLASNLDIHRKGAVIGMAAGLTLSAHSSRFVALFSEHKNLIKLFNTPHNRYEIPAGIYDTIYDNVTSIDNLKLVDIGWYLFSQDLTEPNSDLARLRDSDPVYAELLSRMDGLHADTHIQTEYVLHARALLLPNVRNRLHHSRVANLVEEAGKAIQGDMYKVRALVFKDVARIKKMRTYLLTFSDEQVRRIKSILEPGDILLTYTAGYMSNVFLPGKFKHGITYIGTVEDRRRVGLTDDLLRERAVSEEQAQQLIEQASRETTADGDKANIIEAVAEGVVMHSLDHLLATHINRLAVIRPKISDEERIEHLVAQLQYLGTGYDFRFDFQDDTYQCCTELVYRTTHQKGTIDYSLIKMKGMWILAADDILRYYLTQNPEAFDFILLADQGPDPADHAAVLHTGPEGLEKLRQLMEVTGASQE